VSLAQQRMPADLGNGTIDFRVGDMFDPTLGHFDHVVAMDSLIHYRAPDVVRVLSGLAALTRGSMVFTFAPRTPALTVMHTVGRLFPRGNRAPSIEPITPATICRLIETEPNLRDWRLGRSERIASGFYTSQALEITRVGKR
jgi:magnesium-protoporphyrin O-methyltransferase